MKIMNSKKFKEKKDNNYTLEIISPIACTGDKTKGECALLERLRNIQTELSQINDYEDERRNIIAELFGVRYSCRYTDYSREQTDFMMFVGASINYYNIEKLDAIISLIQKYRDLTEKCIHAIERSKQLKSEAAMIKKSLGIN